MSLLLSTEPIKESINFPVFSSVVNRFSSILILPIKLSILLSISLKVSSFVNKLSKIEHFSSKYKYGDGDMTKPMIILFILINLIISYLFIVFSFAYINEIDPNLNIKNKSLYLFLVYVLLFTNSFMFIDGLLSLFTLFTY